MPIGLGNIDKISFNELFFLDLFSHPKYNSSLKWTLLEPHADPLWRSCALPPVAVQIGCERLTVPFSRVVHQAEKEPPHLEIICMPILHPCLKVGPEAEAQLMLQSTLCDQVEARLHIRPPLS